MTFYKYAELKERIGQQRRESIGKKQGRTVHNDQGINPRRHNNYKHICTQHRSTSVHKATANSYKRGNRQ